MSAIKDLYTSPRTFGGDYDSIIITDYFQGKRGGATLDFTGYGRDYIRAGHVIIKETGVEDSLKPMPVTGTGAITTLGAITAGSAYDDDTYTGVSLTGGSGSGATANITVTGGAVTNVELVNAGSGYVAGVPLSADSADLGGTGSGFAVAVTAVGAFATAYDSLPGSHEYYGFAVNTVVRRGNAGVANGVAVRGNINPEIGKNTGAAELGYFDLTPILSAVKAAIPTFTFLGDNQ